MDLSQTVLERTLNIVPTDTKQLQLILTDAANLFASLKPAQGLQLPVLPPLTNLWQIINSNGPQQTIVPTPVPIPTTTAPQPISYPPDIIPTTMPTFRLPVTTRPPGVPHHRITNDALQSELIDKVYKFMNGHESFEIRYTNRFKSTDQASEIPNKSPEMIATESLGQENIPTTPPLFHNSDDAESSRVALPETNENTEDADAFLSLPQLPAKPFSSKPFSVVMSDETLPIEGNENKDFNVRSS